MGNDTELTDDEKLNRYAKRVGGTQDEWYFGGSAEFTHSRAAALEVIDACLILGVTVTDVVSSKTWLKMVLRIVSLERRVAALERP